MSRTVRRVQAEFAELDFDGWNEEDEDHKFKGTPGEIPPEGECFQVWQDVGDDSPISPVFLNLDDCAAWLTRTHDCSLAAALKLCEDGWAPSFIGTQFGLYSGVQMAAGLEAHMEYIAPEGSHAPGTRIRHLVTDVEGKVSFRMPPPNGEYYAVVWDRALYSMAAADPSIDPDKPFEAGCREDGFEVLPS